MGCALLEKLQEKQITVTGFLVTDSKNNRKEESGLPVLGIDDVELQKDHLVLVAVKQPWNKDICEVLERKGYNYLDIIPEFEKFNKKPDLFEITASIGCSVSCKFCPQSVLMKNYRGTRMLDFKTYCAIVGRLPERLAIGFSGFSEPFLNPNMPEMIVYAYEKGHPVLVCSTLVGLTLEKFQVFREVPMENFTLHVPDRNGYARIPMTKEYYEILDEVLGWKQEKNGRAVPVIRKANCQGEVHPDILKFINNRVLVFPELADRAGNLASDEMLASVPHELRGKIRCSYSPNLNNLVMLPNGDIVLCCMDFGLKHVLGNILTDSFESIKNGKKLAEIKAAMQDETEMDILCRRCTEARKIDGN